MFSEILKINPKIDTGDLNKMETSLTSRFGKIAKKFGSGIKSALSLGGFAGIALVLIDKILNPLKEIQEQIDKTLHKADDISVQAKQFNTTSGNLFKLQTLAQARGLGPEELGLLLEKFQTASAQALADPSKQTAVRNFAFKGQDNAEAFFQFIQAMQKLPKEQQVLAQGEIFGEKQILRAAEFLNTPNLGGLAKKVAPAPSDSYTKKIDRVAELSDVDKIQKAQLSVKDFIETSDKLKDSQITGINLSQGIQEARGRNHIDNFSKVKTVDDAVNTITEILQQMLSGVTGSTKALENISVELGRIPGAKLLRGVLPTSKDN